MCSSHENQGGTAAEAVPDCRQSGEVPLYIKLSVLFAESFLCYRKDMSLKMTAKNIRKEKRNERQT